MEIIPGHQSIDKSPKSQVLSQKLMQFNTFLWPRNNHPPTKIPPWDPYIFDKQELTPSSTKTIRELLPIDSKSSQPSISQYKDDNTDHQERKFGKCLDILKSRTIFQMLKIF